MSEWSAKRKLFVAVCTGLIAVVAIIFLVMTPLVAGLDELHRQAQTSRNLYNQLVQEEASYKTAALDLKRIDSRIIEIEALFPIKENLVGFIERLETIAQQFESDFSMTITDAEELAETLPKNAKLEEPGYAIVPDLKDVEVIPYDFELVGSFEGIVKFLQTLENQPFNSEIERFALRSELIDTLTPGSEERNRTGRVHASIRAAFYAQQQKEQ